MLHKAKCTHRKNYTTWILFMIHTYIHADCSQFADKDKDLKMVIDHDAGADDAFAIFMALHYEKHFKGPNVVAILTNHGNVDEPQTFYNTQKILNIANRRNIPIYRGSNESLLRKNPVWDGFFGNDGLGDNGYGDGFRSIPEQDQHAAFALIELSKMFEGRLLVVSLGALTNIALAIRLDPMFVRRLYQLYVVAGHLRNDTFMNPEFNANVDVEAYDVAIRDAHPDFVTLIPFSSVIFSLKIYKKWRKEIFGSLDTTLVTALNAFEKVSIEKVEKWDMLDPAAMAVILNKDIVSEMKYSDHSIILCGEHRGKTINSFVTIDKANINTLFSMNNYRYKKFLWNVFSIE